MNRIYDIAEPYFEEAVSLFTQKTESTSTLEGAWYELIYCVLAGSQIRVEKVKQVTDILLDTCDYDLGNASSLEELAGVLKSAGYRYHTVKAGTLLDVRSFVLDNLQADPRNIRNLNLRSARAELMSVKGVGQKIANHWLRNMGFATLTADVHIFRLLKELSLMPNVNPDLPKRADFVLALDIISEAGSSADISLGEFQYAL